MTAEADVSAPTRVRAAVFVAVALLHGLAVVGLLRAFAPDLVSRTVDAAVATFVVTEPARGWKAPTSPAPRSGAAGGSAGAAGRRAIPREVAAPPVAIAIASRPAAPTVASTGPADRSGAHDSGAGAGSGGSGSGTGSDGAGSGEGSGRGNGPGGGSKAVKIAGEINSARDYPAASRDLRIGDHVIIVLTVGTDGRPTACQVQRASRDPAADEITCRLALARFRFRPATDASGAPVVAMYGWQQRWFYRGQP